MRRACGSLRLCRDRKASAFPAVWTFSFVEQHLNGVVVPSRSAYCSWLKRHRSQKRCCVTYIYCRINHCCCKVLPPPTSLVPLFMLVTTSTRKKNSRTGFFFFCSLSGVAVHVVQQVQGVHQRRRGAAVDRPREPLRRHVRRLLQHAG